MLSRELWSLDWNAELPHVLPCGIEIRRSSYDEAGAFAKENFAKVYHFDERPTRFLSAENPPAKERFYRAAGDFFGFYDQGKLVGIAVCAPLDWTSYNFRNVTLLDSHQGRGVYPEFFAYLIEVAERHGIERIEGDVGPSNLPHVVALAKMGAITTGLNLSERWGAMMHIVMYVSQRHQSKFEDQFCESVHRYGGKHSRKPQRRTA